MLISKVDRLQGSSKHGKTVDAKFDSNCVTIKVSDIKKPKLCPGPLMIP